ncbi:hypothetical protein VPH35_113283 [Triticum aestivum]|uniref:F-box domain-containing protein n=3 Tax=Triticum TaxID=4564 RepID=A0A9R0YXW3_TRITD|nr:putative FBD-associated F-box protein At5g56820 [Triticum aestivum]XP_044409996.1 putative FBD-associated F-box protein At5g56820 [Triticum aestivum]XP_044409997.1 putative FBD-associated F-box protein At5g56820 [Triticum aestivum]VAI62502.1 unnamed protein product [Triticum turgidum subsp. durum]
MVNTRSRSLPNEEMEGALASGEDRIGALPDDLLQNVMSFLLSRDAMRTCVLARRWSTLWKSVPALRIEDDLATDSNKFVDELLRLRDPAPLNVCDICDVSEDSDTEDPETFCEEAYNRIAPCLRYALLHQVRVLRVSAPVFPTDLVLVSSHLKRVELCHMQFEDSLDFSSCQVLDVLEMTDCNIYAPIICQSLRHLNMKGGCFDNEVRYHISAPNLVSLKLAPESGLTPLLDSMPSLVTASVESSEEEFHHCFALLSCDDGCTREETFSVVLEGLSAATNLELTSDDLLSVFRMDLKWSPVFSKVKMLLLNNWCVAGDFTGLVYFLQHSPILETLTLQLNIPTPKKQRVNGTDERYAPKKQSLPSKHLKIVKIICGLMKDDARVYRALKMLCAHGVPFEKIDIQ